jgi:hypothetical protein
MDATIRFLNLFTRHSGTAAVSGGTAVNVLGDGVVGCPYRQGINIKNQSTTDGIWVYMKEGDINTPPTISATENDILIPPNENRTIQGGGAIQCWVISNNAGATCAFTAVEVG